MKRQASGSDSVGNETVIRGAVRRLIMAGVAIFCLADGLAQPSPARVTHLEQKRRILSDPVAFDHDRSALLDRHLRRRPRVDEALAPKEREVNRFLKRHLAKTYQANRENVRFGPAIPFYRAKSTIQNDPLFAILRKMPKGGLLHVHLTAVGRMDWVLEKAFATPNCYVHWPSDGSRKRGELRIMTPHEATRHPNFILLSAKNQEYAAQGRSFESSLRSALTIGEEDVGGNERVWAEFGDLFGRTSGFIRHESMLTDYLIDAFQTLWDDGVYYVELRDSSTDARQLQAVVDARAAMKQRHPKFDCRLILSAYRGATAQEVVDKLADAVRLRGQFTNLIAGFDLVGEEFGTARDTTHVVASAVLGLIATNRSARVEIATGKVSDPDGDLPYLLHDGESCWADNENLIDAVLLGSPRIGHAFNLFRFPSLYDEIRDKKIALEICPISNQLLGLSPDLRTHPAAGYINAGLQCVLASDDPLIFGNDGLSYDFWEAVVAWNLDLPTVKRLGANSIEHSMLDQATKASLMGFWAEQWDRFIDQVPVPKL